MHQAARTLQHAVQDGFGAAHFPQHVHMDATVAAGDVMGDAGLGDAAADAVGDQLLMALAPGLAVIDDRNQLAGLVVEIGIDAREGGDAARGRPGARAFAVGDGNAFAALHQGEDFTTGNNQGLQRFHVWFLSLFRRGRLYNAPCDKSRSAQ